MTLKQKMAVIMLASIVLLISLQIGKWIIETNQIPKKPFTIIKKECNSFSFMMCTYTFVDSTGTSFKMSEPSDKYSVGQIIK